MKDDKNITQIDIKVYWKDGYGESWIFTNSGSKRKVWKAIKKFFEREDGENI